MPLPIDLDKDNLVYNWSFTNDSIQSHNINPQYVFNEPGIYNISLTVKDNHGNVCVAKKEILFGNENPIVEWNIVGNSSFYWNDTPFQYSVVVSDAEDDKIKDAKFVGEGCSISLASASMMTEAIKGLAVSQSLDLVELFSKMMQGEAIDIEKFPLEDIEALTGVTKFPARIKCATLAWNALRKGVEEQGERRG